MKVKLCTIFFFLILIANLTAAEVPFREGEKLTFTVKYGIISAGEASLQTESSVYLGAPVWRLSTTAKTIPSLIKVIKSRHSRKLVG